MISLADYLLYLMQIEAGVIPAPPEIVKAAKEQLNEIGEYLKEQEYEL